MLWLRKKSIFINIIGTCLLFVREVLVSVILLESGILLLAIDYPLFILISFFLFQNDSGTTWKQAQYSEMTAARSRSLNTNWVSPASRHTSPPLSLLSRIWALKTRLTLTALHQEWVLKIQQKLLGWTPRIRLKRKTAPRRWPVWKCLWHRGLTYRGQAVRRNMTTVVLRERFLEEKLVRCLLTNVKQTRNK